MPDWPETNLIDVLDALEQERPELAVIFATAIEIALKKNRDYGNNLTACERLGVPAWKGVLIRMTDKMSRLENLIRKGGEPAAVTDESLRDTLLDLGNYAFICASLLPRVEQRADGAGEGYWKCSNCGTPTDSTLPACGGCQHSGTVWVDAVVDAICETPAAPVCDVCGEPAVALAMGVPFCTKHAVATDMGTVPIDRKSPVCFKCGQPARFTSGGRPSCEKHTNPSDYGHSPVKVVDAATPVSPKVESAGGGKTCDHFACPRRAVWVIGGRFYCQEHFSLKAETP